MKRPYNQKRRAEQAAETRQRIVEAAIQLHGTIGPARTSLSMVAARAGVQRHTLYAHFPDERAMAMACSGEAFVADPPPDAANWQALAAGSERLAVGIAAIYGWYARNATLMACVLRDAESHPLTGEIVALRMGAGVAAWHDALGEGLGAAPRAMLHAMLGFFTWRALGAENGLAPEAAAALAVRAILAAG